MSIITGFDNTDSSSIGSKFYLGKITGQENIGSRDANGNPIPYYSSGDIGTLQSSVILQKFNEDEFKGPETAPNTAWIDFLNPVNPSDTTKTKKYSSFGFTKDVTWTIGLNDRDTEINYVTKILSHWNDHIVNFGGVDYYFKDVYFVPVRQDLYLASDNFQTILKTPDDLFNALNDIKDSTSYLTIPVSNDARFFNEVIVDGEHNLYNFSNQLVAKNYLAAQDLYSNKSFFSFDAIYNVLEGIRSKADLLIGDKALRDLSLLNYFQANTSYDNLTSGIIGNYDLITGLNLTGIHGFPTGYISGQYLKANETGLDFVTITDPVLDFTGLSDTPSDITPVKFLRGNQAGTSLEFTGVKFLEDVEDRPASPITSGYLQLTNQNTLIWNPVAPGGGDVTYNFTGSEYFTGLKDTPDNYDLNKFLRSTNVGLEYVDINNNIVSFQGLSDTPSNFSANQYVKVNATADGLEYGTIPSPLVDFTELNDTPTDYTNSSGYYLRVNSSEDGVEFINISGQISSQEIAWESYLRYGDLPNASDHPGMFAHVFIDELGGNSGSAYISHNGDWVQIFPTVPNLDFTGLNDTPNDYLGHSGKYLKVSDGENGLEYANLPDPVVDFTGLTDTPASFAGQSKKYLQVNSAEDSLEFVDPLFSTGSFVGFGGASVLIGLETTQPVQGWNDRQVTQLQGHSGVIGLTLNNNQITLPGGKYLINAEGGVFRSEATRIGVEFTAGDYVGQRFESRSNYAGSALSNNQGGARGSVKAVVQSNNPMTFKVVSFVGNVRAASPSDTTFEFAQTDVTVLDLGGDRDVLSITGLYDTPNSFDNSAGKFLQINNSEDGVEYSSLSGQISSQEIDWLAYSTVADLPSASDHHGMFAHVHSEGAAYMAHAGNWEKIYPVNGGSLTFTGLSDTPNFYDDGKILQSTANGLEWVDMPAGGGGGSISSDNLYQTYLDKSSNVTVFKKANSPMSPNSTVNVFEYRNSNPIYIYGGNFQSSFANNPKITIDDVLVTNTEGLIVGQDQHDSDISVITIPPIYATGHVQIQWHNSSASTQHYGGLLHYATGNDIQTIDVQGGGAGGGSSYEFCKLGINSTQYSPSNSQNWLNFNGDPLTGSADWKYLDPAANVWGVKPDKPGYYNIDAAYKIIHHSKNSLTSELHIWLYKRNINTNAATLIGYGTEFFDDSAGWNGPKVEADIQNIYLTEEEVVTVRANAYRAGTTANHQIEKNSAYTYLNVSRADIGGGGGGSSTFAGLTDTPNTLTEGSGQYLKVSDDGQTIEYVDLPAGGGGGSSNYEFCKAHIDSNVRLVDSSVQSSVNVIVDPNNLTQGSQDWTYDAGNGIIGLRPPEDGHYNIEGFVQNLGTAALNPSWATVRTKRCFIQKLDISTNTSNTISERTETKDSGNDGILTVEFNEPNVFLTTNDVIFVATQLNSSTTNTAQFPVSPGAFISLTKASGGESGGNSSTSSGGIGDNEEVISASNFGSKIPDVILLHPSNEQNDPRCYRFFGIDQGSSVILYRIDSTDKQIAFQNNSAGDFDATFTNTGHVRYTGDTTLQSIIDNGHAVYFGGGSSSSGGGGSSSNNIFGARIEVDSNNVVTIVSQTSDFIESINHIAPGNNFDITFKDGIFTEPPIAQFTARNKSGSVLEGAVVNSDESSGTDYANGKKITIKWELVGASSFDGNQTNGNYGADLLFIKNGDDFSLNGGGGGGGNSSTSNGGIGSDPGVIAKSNFSELFPDRINVPIIRSSEIQERYFTFEGFFKRLVPNDMVQYEWNIGGSERFAITFQNNANGDWDAYSEINDTANTDVDFSKIPSAITNQPTLKEFIDAGRAIYLGGGGSTGDAGTSTGGRGNLDVLKNNLENFQHTLPDSIVVTWGGGGYEATFDLFAVRPASADTTANNGSNWDIYYTCGRGHTDGELMFTDDADGTLVQANAPIDQTPGGDFAVGTLTLKWLIDNGRAFYAGGTSDSGGGSASAFSKMSFLSTDRVGHGGANFTPDSGNLATGAENWIYHDTTNNLYGLRPTSDGYYDIDVCVEVNSADGDSSSFGADVSYGTLGIIKRNVDDLTTSSMIARDWENKGYDQGANIVNRVNESYVYLTTKDVIYASYGMWVRPASQSKTWGISPVTSYISLSPSAAGGGGGSSTFAGLTDTPSTLTEGSGQYLKVSDDGQTIEYVDLPAGGGGAGGSNILAQGSYNHAQAQLTNDYNISGVTKRLDGVFDIVLNTPIKNVEYNLLAHTVNASTINSYGGDKTENGFSITTRHNDSHARTDASFDFVVFGISGAGGGGVSANGGAGDNSFIQAESNFDGKIPDQIIISSINSSPNIAYFHRIDFHNGPNDSKIMYQMWTDGLGSSSYYLEFDNDASGLNPTFIGQTNYYRMYNEDTSLQKIIDNGRAIYLGGGGGSSTFAGLTDTPSTLTEGSGQYLKVSDDGQTIEYVDLPAGGVGGGASGAFGNNTGIANLSNYYDIIPDAVYNTSDQTVNTNTKDILILRRISDGTIEYSENTALTNRILIFNNDAEGSWSNIKHTLDPDFNSISGFVANGQAVFFGDGGSSANGGGGGTISAINQIQENIDNIPLIGSGVQIPDAILVKDINATTTNGADNLIQLDYRSWTNYYDSNGNITSSFFDYEANNYVTKRWFIRFDSTDGSYISVSADQEVKKEFNSIQEYISNDRALYFGGGGGSSTFAGLTDTPSTLTEGSGQYLKVSDDGQTIEYVDLPAGSVGGIGDSAEVINLSNFGSKIPDIIQIANPSNQTPISYQFRHIDAGAMQFYDVVGNSERIRFNNDISGTYLDDTISSYSRYPGDTTLQSIIDNGHAIYFGGGDSSSNAIIQQGTYTGNSTANNAEQFINLGFTPIRVEIFGKNDYKAHAILLKDKTDNLASWRALDGSHDDHRSYTDRSIIVENGFKVSNHTPANSSHLNYNGVEFDYYVTAEAQHQDGNGGGGSSSTSSEIHTFHGEWLGSINGTQPGFDDLTSGAQYLIGGTVGFGGDMSNLRVQLLSGTIGDGLNNPFSLAAAGGAVYDFSHIASFSQIITATGSYHELQFESIGTVTSSVIADYNLYAKRV